MTLLLTREAAIGAKVEATEGTAETLAAADAALLPYDLKFDPDVPYYKRRPHRSKLTGLAGIPGRKLARVTFKSEFKGSGAVATVPEWDVYARICGLSRSAISTAAIGAIAGGPFQGGETATLAPSGATVRIAGDHANGATLLRYVVLTGVPANGDTATGGTSGATATLSAGPTAAQGYEYLPTSSEPPSATVAVWRDGKRHTLVGCRGNVKWTHKANEPVMMEWDILGVWTETIDEAIPASIPYQEITPAAWVEVGFTVGAFSAIIEGLTLDLGNTLEPRVSVNAANGVLSILRPTRDAKGEIDPEDNPVAEHDWLGRFRAGTAGRLSYQMGSGTGKRLAVTCPQAQYENAEENDRAGLLTLKVSMVLVSPTIAGGDDEIQVVMW